MMFSLFSIIGACIDRSGPANPIDVTEMQVEGQTLRVLRYEAAAHREVLMEALSEWPSGHRHKPLANGPSHTDIQRALHCGATDARELMAIGAVLGLWEIVQLHGQTRITGYAPAMADATTTTPVLAAA